eukprot:Skav213068  [mRNA]  locus=scaffold4152:56233:66699:- [translate_table: standard]
MRVGLTLAVLTVGEARVFADSFDLLFDPVEDLVDDHEHCSWANPIDLSVKASTLANGSFEDQRLHLVTGHLSQDEVLVLDFPDVADSKALEKLYSALDPPTVAESSGFSRC